MLLYQPTSLKTLTDLTELQLHENPDLQLFAGAPLDSEGGACYLSAEEVRAFLVCL
jgi:hypothetical protein